MPAPDGSGDGDARERARSLQHHAVGSSAQEDSMRLSIDELRGRTIVAADGHVIGELTNVFVDSDTWRVDSIQARLRKEAADQLGAPRSLFHAGTIEVPMTQVQSVGDAVLLSVSGDELRDSVIRATRHE
jgi:sporulation protein YlmC with PRC-barrel domain